jgi:AcrR family transcriptional regulator
MSKPANPALPGRILRLALEELAEKPPERINMRELARKAGVSATAIYYYFPSKAALFERIKFDAMEELDARVAAADLASKLEKPLERLRTLMRTFVAWCAEAPELARLLMEGLPYAQAPDEAAMRRYYSVHERAREILAEAVAAGKLSPRDLDLEVSLAQAALWGIVSQVRGRRLHPRFWDSVEPLVDRLAALIAGGTGEEP